MSLHSMTGYGRQNVNLGESKGLMIEIKCLNSKFFDVSLRLPAMLRPFEPQIRSTLSATLYRGKVDVGIELVTEDLLAYGGINEELIRRYIQDLKRCMPEENLETTDLIAALLRVPGILDGPADPITESQWKVAEEGLAAALAQVVTFRQREGEATAKHVEQMVRHIMTAVDQVEQLEGERLDLRKSKLLQLLAQEVPPGTVDKNRFEQELIYHMDKFDISEERDRLRVHCQHFLNVMNEEGMAKGKQLNFVSQEMGREINTMGAKANHVGIQQHVVDMKGNLESIREQLMNIL